MGLTSEACSDSSHGTARRDVRSGLFSDQHIKCQALEPQRSCASSGPLAGSTITGFSCVRRSIGHAGI